MLTCIIGEKKLCRLECRTGEPLGVQLAMGHGRSIICGVTPGSPASAAGVHDSTFLTAVDGEPVADQSLDTLLEMVEEAVETKGWVELEVALPVAPAAPPSPAKPAAREAPPTGHATLPSHVSHNVPHPVETSKAHVHETAIPSDFAACATFEAVPTVKTWQPAPSPPAHMAFGPRSYSFRPSTPFDKKDQNALGSGITLRAAEPEVDNKDQSSVSDQVLARDEEEEEDELPLSVHIGINTGVGMLDDSFTIKVLGCGVQVGRRVGVVLLDNNIGVTLLNDPPFDIEPSLSSMAMKSSAKSLPPPTSDTMSWASLMCMQPGTRSRPRTVDRPGIGNNNNDTNAWPRIGVGGAGEVEAVV